MPYVIGGQQVNLQDEPRNLGGPIYVPLRQVMEQIGGTLSWDSEGKTAGATYQGKHARIPTNSSDITVDGQTVSLSVPPSMDGNDVWVPVEFFDKAFGVPAVADGGTNTVTVQADMRQAA